MKENGMKARNIFEKLWDEHVIAHLDAESDLLHIDRCYVHDLGGSLVLNMLKSAGRKAIAPSSVYCCPDHTVSEQPGRNEDSNAYGALMVKPMYALAKEQGLNLIPLSDARQGIIHNIGLEQGLSLPGMTVVCGDSHTCTHGAIGAMAWGIGTSDLSHVLATRTLAVKKPKTMRIVLNGKLRAGTEPMDIVLYILSSYGTAMGVGYALEYAGNVIEEMEIEDRATLCNLSVELGAQICMMEPDEKAIAFLKSHHPALETETLRQLLAYCEEIRTDEGAVWDREVEVCVDDIVPQITWGINPSQTMPIDGKIPTDASMLHGETEEDFEKALEYTKTRKGEQLLGTKVDRVFIGSCANGRLPNLKRAAEVVKGKKVAPGVTAWVIPGSKAVKEQAEALGVDQIFTEAGFLWGEPGCSLCSCANGQTVGSGQRCISTSNRNFVGRQGPGAITHLASPSTAAISAVRGVISDIRKER